MDAAADLFAGRHRDWLQNHSVLVELFSEHRCGWRVLRNEAWRGSATACQDCEDRRLNNTVDDALAAATAGSSRRGEDTLRLKNLRLLAWSERSATLPR